MANVRGVCRVGTASASKAMSFLVGEGEVSIVSLLNFQHFNTNCFLNYEGDFHQFCFLVFGGFTDTVPNLNPSSAS